MIKAVRNMVQCLSSIQFHARRSSILGDSDESKQPGNKELIPQGEFPRQAKPSADFPGNYHFENSEFEKSFADRAASKFARMRSAETVKLLVS